MTNNLLLLVLIVSHASGAEPEAAPKRTVVPVASNSQALAEAFGSLQGKVSGLPEGWDSPSALRRDPLLRELFKTKGFMDGHSDIMVEDGAFKGLRVTFGGKAFLIVPPAQFAVGLPEGGKPATTALSLKGSELVERTLGASEAFATRQQAVTAQGRAVLPEGGRAFDGSVRRDDAVLVAGRHTQTVILPAPLGEFRPVARPAGGKLSIVNSYKGTPPESLAPGQFFWEGKTLMSAEAVLDGGVIHARAVGYMADMKGDPGGDLVFWHGGAAPNAKGTHAKAKENWSLLYIPKLEANLEVEGGNTTAHHVSSYAMMHLGGAKVVKTAEGSRIDLTSVLQSVPVVRRLPPADEPETRALLRFGTPVEAGKRTFNAYVDMQGNTYQEQEAAGRKYVVRVGALYSVKAPPASGLAQDSGLVAPAERADENAKARPTQGESDALRTRTARWHAIVEDVRQPKSVREDALALLCRVQPNAAAREKLLASYAADPRTRGLKPAQPATLKGPEPILGPKFGSPSR